MIDIFDEVSDDLRAERAATLLRRYGGLLIAGAILVLLGVAGEQAWEWEQGQQDAKAAQAYLGITVTIAQQGDGITNPERLADAKALESFAAGAPAGYRALAALRAAGLYADAGNLSEAATLWNRVSGDSGADALLRQEADLLWAQHELGVAPDDAVLARIAPLTAPDNPYHALAQETQALIDLDEGKTDQAKALFSQITADPAAPDAARNRAGGLLAKLNG